MNLQSVPAHIGLVNAFIIDSLVLFIIMATHVWFRKSDRIRANVLENFLIIIIIATLQNIVSCFILYEKSIDWGIWPLAFMIAMMANIFFAVMYTVVTYSTCRQISRLYTFIYGFSFFIIMTIEDILFYWHIVAMPDWIIWFSYCLFLFIHAIFCLIKRFKVSLIDATNSYQQGKISGLLSVSIGFFIVILVGVIITAVVFSHEILLSDHRMRAPIANVLIYYSILSLVTVLPFYFKRYDKAHVIGCSFVLAVIVMVLLNFYIMASVLFDWWVFYFPFLVFFCIHFFDEVEPKRD